VISRFFIDRPVFAGVISVTITLVGWIAGVHAPRGPVSRYLLRPPCRSVASIPGPAPTWLPRPSLRLSSSRWWGVENVLYMSSQCTNDGGYNLTVTFEVGTNLDMAQVLVAKPGEPGDSVAAAGSEADGVSVKKSLPAFSLS